MENFISPLRFKKSNYVIRLFSNYGINSMKSVNGEMPRALQRQAYLRPETISVL